jgi:DNA-binding transcriptional LysR family regulator
MRSTNIDLRALRHVLVLSRLLSYTKASQELCLSQSALSRSIKAIEQQAKVQLFDRDRGGGGVHLTAVGRAFVERAAALIRDANDLERMLQQSASAEIGEVAFGMGPLPAKALLQPVLTEAVAVSPQLRSNVMVRSADALLSYLLAEKIEFFICAEGQVPDSALVQSELLGWLPISLLVRSGHPIFKSQTTGLDHKYPLLSSGQFKATHKWPTYMRPYLKGPVHVIEDHDTLVSITEQTDSIWISSAFSAAAEIRARRLREILPPNGERVSRFRVMNYSLDKRSLSPVAVKIISKFRDLIRTLGRDAPVG